LKNIPEATSILIFSVFKHLHQNEKTYVHGRYLEPTAVNFVRKSDIDKSKEPSEHCSVAFFAFPFLALEPLWPQNDLTRASTHPVRSLLQFQYSFESTGKRDKHQVVLKTGESKDVLHVPQVWMLLINGGRSSLNQKKYELILIFSQM
jgi:hypothetical protein